MAKPTDLQRFLNNFGIHYHVINHEPAPTAAQVALKTHIPQRELAKTVVVQVDGKFWMTVLRADYRVNTKLLKRILGAKEIRLAHEEDLSDLFPDCETGMMPPFGNLYAIPVLVDKPVSDDVEIVFNACSATKAIRMRFADYESLVHPLIGRFGEPAGLN